MKIYELNHLSINILRNLLYNYKFDNKKIYFLIFLSIINKLFKIIKLVIYQIIYNLSIY